MCYDFPCYRNRKPIGRLDPYRQTRLSSERPSSWGNAKHPEARDEQCGIGFPDSVGTPSDLTLGGASIV
jgi:hypothetical protein